MSRAKIPQAVVLVFLVAQAVYLAATASNPERSGWKMFNRIHVETFEIKTRMGQSVDYRQWLVFPAYGLSRRQAMGLARHICRIPALGREGLVVSFNNGGGTPSETQLDFPSCR